MKTRSAIESRLYDFIDVLRDAGIDVSAEEVLSLFGALTHVSIMEKNIFRQALKTTLVKDYTDIPLFDRCFDSFFTPGEDAQSEVVKAFRDMRVGDAMRELAEMTPDLKRTPEEALRDFIESLPDGEISGRTLEVILDMFVEWMARAESGGGTGQMSSGAGNTEATASYTGETGGESVRGLSPGMINALRGLISARLSDKNIGTRLREREIYLLNKQIYRITPDEINEMLELIRRFGQKMKNRISLRKKRVTHGGIDIKRTLRSSIQFGGIPFRIYRKDRKIDRPQLVVMCDISGSVNQYSRFMLLLAYSLQNLFSKVRSFAFISTLVEITPLFMEMNPERALNSIFDDTNFTYGWGSNYGRCFDQFIREYADSLGGKTTVLVLGDGRNNYQDPGLESFIRIRERSRNLYWLNPDRRHLWSWADSVASQYAEYCTEMKEVNNFLDLSEFIDKLFPGR